MMVKSFRRVAAIVLAGAAALCLAGCGGGDQAKKYIIATDTTFAPFEFEKDGQRVGIDMDLIAAIAEDQGFEYEMQVLGFDAAVQALEGDQVDAVIAGCSITEERKLKFDFSDPYYDSKVAMGVKADNTTVNSYEDLRGKTVAVKKGTEGANFAEKIKKQYDFTTKSFDDSAFMYEDVKTGNSIACFEDFPVLAYGVQQNNGLKIVGEQQQGSSYGFAVNKGKNAELLEMFNKGLANLKANGKYQEIVDKYTK